MFDYVVICGNHIIWGCRNVQEYQIRHIGEKESASDRFRKAFSNVRTFADADTSQERNLIAAARTKTLGRNRAETTDFIHDQGVPAPEDG